MACLHYMETSVEMLLLDWSYNLRSLIVKLRVLIVKLRVNIKCGQVSEKEEFRPWRDHYGCIDELQK